MDCTSSAENLNFQEVEREVVRVDHVVLDTFAARIRFAGRELRKSFHSARLDQLQPACRERYDDVVVAVPMPTCRCARREAPFRDAHTVVLDVH